MKPFYKNLALWLVIGLVIFLVFDLFQVRQPGMKNLVFSDFISKLDQNQISEVTIKNNYISGVMKDGSHFKTYAANDPNLVQELQKKNVRIVAIPPEDNPWYLNLLISWGPIIVLVLLWVFFMRQMQSGGNKAMSFGKSRAKLITEDKRKITFADVAGVEEAKEEVAEIVEFLKDPTKFQRLGGRIPKGVLVVGPPGTGKTLLAKAIAGEADVPFYHISGSDFVEMFVGVGASRVRDLFEQGKKNAPCIIFIDEIDAVGRHRGAGLGGGHDEREQTLNQMLVEMDGFETKDGVIILAATNRPDVLDPALLRPGRFDRQVVVAMPDVKEREDILAIHMKKIPVDPAIDSRRIAQATPGTSGADLANLVNEAALFAIRKGREIVEMSDFEDARDKVMMGAARKSLFITDEEKRATAVHEAGHALVTYFVDHMDPLHKVTIIPRGRALGLALALPEKDAYSHSESWLRDYMVFAFGGYAAEKVVYGETTTGTAQDLRQATDFARKMVCEWGMAESMGPVAYGQEEEPIFIGKEIARHKDYSEDTAMKIDNAIRVFLDEAAGRAIEILTTNKDKLEKLASELITRETLLDADIKLLFGFPEKHPKVEAQA